MYKPDSSGSPLQTPPLTRAYSKRTLYTFIVAYVLTWLLALMGQGQSSLFGLGMGLFYGLIAALLLLDIRGLLSLQNAIPPWRNRLVFGLLCLFTLPIWVGIYLARTFRAYRRPPLVLAPVRRKAAPALATGVVVTLALALIFASASPSESAPVVVKPEMTSTAAIAQIAQETIATAAPTPTPIPTATPTPVPAPTPKPQPTATPMPAPQPMKAPAPRATQAPAPSHRSGIGGNPYGFDLNPPGALIYSPPSDICNYISCIANFWHGRGYVEECQDGMFSKSGGIRGSCSYHGGDKQPLYKH